MIKESQIQDLNHVKVILDNLKPINDYIDNFLEENTYEYEHACEEIMFQLCEVEGFVIGKEKYNSYSLYLCNMRILTYYDYLKGNINFKELLSELREYSE